MKKTSISGSALGSEPTKTGANLSRKYAREGLMTS